jgi:hypothetical protein
MQANRDKDHRDSGFTVAQRKQLVQLCRVNDEPPMAWQNRDLHPPSVLCQWLEDCKLCLNQWQDRPISWPGHQERSASTVDVAGASRPTRLLRDHFDRATIPDF